MTQYRLRVLQFIIPILMFLVSIRLFYWQIIRGQELTSKAISQHSNIVTLEARRGNILASDNSILVGTETRYLLYLYRPDFENSPESVINQITPILLTNQEIASSSAEIITPIEDQEKDLRSYLYSRFDLDQSWIVLKHHLTRDQKEQIESLNISGLGFEEENIRFYPEASMSAHLLGFVGNDATGNPKGYFGLEGFYNRQLQGRSGKIKQETDATGNPILIGNFSEYLSQNGHDLQTTINRSIQYQVEKLLNQGLIRYGAVQGSVILMDTKSGAILAMASAPNYDPRIFYKFDSSLHKNPVISDLFEPGSIFKPMIMASALDAGVIDPETRCDICAQPIVIGQYTIKTWNNEYHPNTTMTETIINSDNTGMVFAARKLGPQKLSEYLEKFGFNELTGIDLQGEATSVLKTPKNIKDIDLATISFGQGIAVTRIQVIAAINTLANRGIWVQPYLVTSFQDGSKIIPVDHSSQKQVISPESAQKITDIMVAAVENGEAKWAKPDNVKIAGKTGTAQIPVSGHYDEEKTIASFAGFFPADSPQYTMLVTLREPTSSPWGSETAAPLWFTIAKQILLLN